MSEEPMELLGEYCREVGAELLVDAKGRGFVIYVVQPPHGRIKECYVRPQFRRQGVGLALCGLVGQMVKELGCTHLLSAVSIKAGSAMNSVAAHLGGGAVITDARDGVLTFEWVIP
jgi:GNAT superfamily N-acetyltransferase